MIIWRSNYRFEKRSGRKPVYGVTFVSETGRQWTNGYASIELAEAGIERLRLRGCNIVATTLSWIPKGYAPDSFHN